VNGNVFSASYNEQIEKFLEKRGYQYMVGDFDIIDSGPHCLINFKGKQPAPDGRSDRVMNDVEQINSSNQIAVLKQSNGGESVSINDMPSINDSHGSSVSNQEGVPQLSSDLLNLHDLGLDQQQLVVVQARINEVMQNQSAIEV